MDTEKFWEPLYCVLTDDYVKKLRIVDPRVQHYEIYVKLNNLDIEKILDIYPKAKIEYSLFKKIKKVSIQGIKGFTIYNVTGKKRTKMIGKHDKEHEKTLKMIQKKGILF